MGAKSSDRVNRDNVGVDRTFLISISLLDKVEEVTASYMHYDLTCISY